MTPLERRLHETIAAHGPISVAQYMEAVLGDPEYGYYRTRDPLGAEGDFTTAPEISQAFGEIIGLWCAVTWRQMGAPDPVHLVELGPGRGTLMEDALRAARTVPDFASALRVALVETSPTLRERQRQTLAGAGETPISWYESFGDVPSGPALVLANEFFDALPVEQVVRTASGWRQIRVGTGRDSGRLEFLHAAETAAPPGLPAALPAALHNAVAGSICEFSPARDAAARDIAARISAQGGAALLIDYGPARSAAGDSLQAVRRHRYAGLLADPGECDLTAHVDFEALAGAARAAGARPHGPLNQGVFLTRLGFAVRAARLVLAAGDTGKAREIATGCHRLTDPAGMGSLFKIVALTQTTAPAPAGFEDETARFEAENEGEPPF